VPVDRKRQCSRSNVRAPTWTALAEAPEWIMRAAAE
jgi:hypothetical protein